MAFEALATIVSCIAGAYATPTYVQSDAGYCPGGSACSRAFTRPVQAGSVLIADFISNVSLVSVSDTLGNRWELVTSVRREFNGELVDMWYTPVPVDAGPDVVTASFLFDAGAPEIHIYEYQGLAANALDCQTANEIDSGVATSGPCRTTVPTELLFAFSDAHLTPTGPGPGYTEREFPSDNGEEDQVVTTPGTYVATFPLPDAGDSVVLLSTFKAAVLTEDAGASLAAVISPALVTVAAGQAVVLDGTGSTPSPGATVDGFQWQEAYGAAGLFTAAGDGGSTLAFSSPSGGAYVFELVVTDTTGARSAPAWAQVNVRAPDGFSVGCGCDAGGPGGVAVAALASALRRRRSRVRLAGE